MLGDNETTRKNTHYEWKIQHNTLSSTKGAQHHLRSNVTSYFYKGLENDEWLLLPKEIAVRVTE